MREESTVIPTDKFVAYALWAWVVFLTLVAWIVWLADRDGPWALIATTACASSAAAAVAHIRLYAVRICLRIRLAQQGGPGAEVRPFSTH